MRIEFRSSDHTYWLGDKQLISVTQLMNKHGLSHDYSCVPVDVLNKKSERGTIIHQEIEQYIRTGEKGFTKELAEFIRLAGELKMSNYTPEVIIHNDMVAGTVDLMCHIDDDLIIVDYKTCAKLYKQAVRWQLSLYDYLSGGKAKEIRAFHLLPENSKDVALEKIPTVEIERLLECERNGVSYKDPGLIVSADLLALSQQAEALLKQAEIAQKEAKATAEEYRELLYKAMDEQGIKSWENLDKSMLITKVEPTTKSQIDGVKLKNDLPEIAAKYYKSSSVKGYVKITLREE